MPVPMTPAPSGKSKLAHEQRDLDPLQDHATQLDALALDGVEAGAYVGLRIRDMECSVHHGKQWTSRRVSFSNNTTLVHESVPRAVGGELVSQHGGE